MATSPSSSLISSAVFGSPFAQTKAPKSLRICCFGSSSSETPESYLRPSAEVGYLLAVRGHVCVNGAGSAGCMSALNEGAMAGNGHIVGVIHEMFWLQKGEDVKGLKTREGSAHAAFAGLDAKMMTTTTTTKKSPTDTPGEGPIRELLVVGGKDLQQRKKMLLEDADGLVVMPGGPGTFDELWEIACIRNLGLSSTPIVCVNINGFYDPFRVILERAWAENLTKYSPEQIMHFADSSEEAIQWIEAVQGSKVEDQVVPNSTKASRILRLSSVMNSPAMGTDLPTGPQGIWNFTHFLGLSCVFALGFVAGNAFAKKS